MFVLIRLAIREASKKMDHADSKPGHDPKSIASAIFDNF
jgi:hypothetical protein